MSNSSTDNDTDNTYDPELRGNIAKCNCDEAVVLPFLMSDGGLIVIGF